MSTPPSQPGAPDAVPPPAATPVEESATTRPGGPGTVSSPGHRRAAGTDSGDHRAGGRAARRSGRTDVAGRCAARREHRRRSGLADPGGRRGAADPDAHPALGVAAVLELSDLPAARRLPGAADRAGRRPGPDHRTDQELRPARPWRRRFPDRAEVVVPAAGRHQAALPGDQRRRGRTRHLQGHPADDGRSALADRGLHHHLVRDPGAVLRDLHPRRGGARAAPGRATRSTRPRPPGTSARTSSAPATTWRSWCTPAPARTSAARKPRCWTRWRAGAGSRG